MYINGLKNDSDILADDDADTCVNLTGSDGCRKNKVWNIFMYLGMVGTVNTVWYLFVKYI